MRNVKEILDRYKNIPIHPEYKQLLYDFIRLNYKWNDHINKSIFKGRELQENASTQAAFKKLSEMKKHSKELCTIRNDILICTSFIVYIGMNAPTEENVKNFKEIYKKIDDAILYRLAIIQRYMRAIQNHTKISIKDMTIPITSKELHKSKIWPNENLLYAAFMNGQNIACVRTSFD